MLAHPLAVATASRIVHSLISRVHFLPLVLRKYFWQPERNVLVPQPSARFADSPSDETSPRHFHWQFAYSYDFVRFRSVVFDADLSALDIAMIWSRSNWLGLEGSVVCGFGDSTLNKADSHLFLYTAGPRITLNSGGWHPWGHALVGGVHMFPQTALSRNGLAFQVGGGVDRSISRSFSARFESDYLRTQLYSSGQNSVVVSVGIDIRF